MLFTSLFILFSKFLDSLNYVTAMSLAQFAIESLLTFDVSRFQLNEMIGGTWYDVAIDIFMPLRHALCERRDLLQDSPRVPQAAVDCNVIVPRVRPRHSHHRCIVTTFCRPRCKMNERFSRKHVTRSTTRCETRWKVAQCYHPKNSRAIRVVSGKTRQWWYAAR